jgi:predicted PurR-regulated permease PerM
MLYKLLIALAVFLVVGIVLNILWAPYAWLIALVVAILAFLYAPARATSPQ